MYKSSETTCAKMKYLYASTELFFSDHCSCGHALIYPSEVLFKADILFSAQLDAVRRAKQFCIRQTYLAEEHSFITFKESHRHCKHHRQKAGWQAEHDSNKYAIGDTVLVKPPRSLKSKYGLEPAIIVDYYRDDNDKQLVPC